MSIYQKIKISLREQKITDIMRNCVSGIVYWLAKSKMVSIARKYSRFIASFYDICAVIFAWLIACWILITLSAETDGLDNISYRFFFVSLYWKPALFDLVCLLLPQLFLFRYFGLYRGFWRFASIQDLLKIFYVSVLGGIVGINLLLANSTGLLSPALNPFSNPQVVTLLPNSVALLYSIFLITFLCLPRLFVRYTKDFKHLYGDFQRVIIVGAGNAGEGLVRDLLRDGSHVYKPVAFVDDDNRKLGREIHGIRVAGTLKELPNLIKKYRIDLALIAIPSASSASMRSVVDLCEKSNIPCYTLPGIKDLTNGRVSINVLRSISLEDLLGRYPVTCQWAEIQTKLNNKTILVTGGGGSIGSELCRQIAALGDSTRLIVVDSHEYNLYAIDMELRKRFPTYDFHPILLSVTDRTSVQAIFKQFRPHMVFHAAAYKHVPLLESQPRMAIFNNIVGTQIIAEEAVEAGVETFVLISTDKAVNPTNIMGATKRAGEYYCQNLNYQTLKTRFITVRFGNVLDSAGSVIPLFRKQIESGGPVTVTHPEITRFFMTIPEASQLILQATFLGQGGEIFVLDMGDPIKIRYLAEQMIKLSGKIVDHDIKIVYTGLRPGEKLFEEYFYPDEFLQSTVHSKILRAQSQWRDFGEIKDLIHQLSVACRERDVDHVTLIGLLKKLVPEYQPAVSSPLAPLALASVIDAVDAALATH